MNKPTPQDLARIVRTGVLDDVIAALDTGIGRDQPAELGLGLAMASFLGHRNIVRELVRRGAPLNLPPGLADASPIMMAIKGKQKKTVQLLISYGAQIPPGVDTGLTHEEHAEAVAKARARRHASTRDKTKTASPPPAKATPEHKRKIAPAATAAESIAPARPAPEPTATHEAARGENPIPVFTSTPAPAPAAGKAKPRLGSIVEEIEITACYGIDTNVLESEVMQLGAAEAPDGNAPKPGGKR